MSRPPHNHDLLTHSIGKYTNGTAAHAKKEQRVRNWTTPKVKIKLHNVPVSYAKASLFPLTTEDIRADVGRTSSLVFQQVVFAHQVLSQAEVCDGNPVSPGCTFEENNSLKPNESEPTYFMIQTNLQNKTHKLDLPKPTFPPFYLPTVL